MPSPTSPPLYCHPRAVFAGGPAVPRRRASFGWLDLGLFVAVLGAVYALFALGRSWLGPVAPVSRISQDPRVLPLYAFYSLVRLSAAYALSLAFALAYGYIAARSRAAERVLVPLLDIVQSIPVLSFLPGVMLAMMALFPRRQLGIELGSVLLIFTGQAWNIAFSFYSSVRTIPRELDEAARIFRFGRWQRFLELEAPFSTIGLVWNSMTSVAGGWFFLMACEMFVLGNRDFRLPGLGSYLQTAASAGNTRAILWGLAAMIGVIVSLDQLVWRPVIAWAEKFKFEQVESAPSQGNSVLVLLGRAALVIWLYRKLIRPVSERVTLALARGARHTVSAFAVGRRGRMRIWMLRIFLAALIALLAVAVFRGGRELAGLHRQDLFILAHHAGLTFLRVNLALLLGALWAVPAGVAIGSSRRLARIAQPLAQIAASVPATALFPIVLLMLIRAGGGMGLASLALMLLGTQWYILFNVIAGAMAIPTDLKEAADVYRFSRWERWRRLILPAIFPYLITGLLTASGGAWNASIVAEYFHFQGKILSTEGLGATISQATDSGHFDLLLAATIIMAVSVVFVNRFVWQRLYRLAATRYKLEA